MLKIFFHRNATKEQLNLFYLCLQSILRHISSVLVTFKEHKILFQSPKLQKANTSVLLTQFLKSSLYLTMQNVKKKKNMKKGYNKSKNYSKASAMAHCFTACWVKSGRKKRIKCIKDKWMLRSMYMQCKPVLQIWLLWRGDKYFFFLRAKKKNFI